MVGISFHYYRVARKPPARYLTKVCVPIHVCREARVWMSTFLELISKLHFWKIHQLAAAHTHTTQTQSTIQTHFCGRSPSSRPQGILGLRKFNWSSFRLLKLFYLLAKLSKLSGGNPRVTHAVLVYLVLLLVVIGGHLHYCQSKSRYVVFSCKFCPQGGPVSGDVEIFWCTCYVVLHLCLSLSCFFFFFFVDFRKVQPG